MPSWFHPNSWDFCYMSEEGKRNMVVSSCVCVWSRVSVSSWEEGHHYQLIRALVHLISTHFPHFQAIYVQTKSCRRFLFSSAVRTSPGLIRLKCLPFIVTEVLRWMLRNKHSLSLSLSQNCSSHVRRAVVTCFSAGCCGRHGNRPVRYCKRCHVNHHSSEVGASAETHLYQTSPPPINTRECGAEELVCTVEAVIRCGATYCSLYLLLLQRALSVAFQFAWMWIRHISLRHIFSACLKYLSK